MVKCFDLLLGKARGGPEDEIEQAPNGNAENQRVDDRKPERKRPENAEDALHDCGSGGGFELVSSAADGMQNGLIEGLVDFLAQAADVHVDDVGLRVEVILPDIL